MKINVTNIRIPLGLCAALFFLGGCYTVLISPGSASRNDSGSDEGGAVSESSSELDYSANCLSCHSQTELDDRSYDMRKVGMVSAHGITIDPYGWQSSSSVTPWWSIPVAMAPSTGVSISTPAASGGDSGKKRSVGEGRGDSGTAASSVPVSTGSTAPTAPVPPPAAGVTRDRNATTGDQNSGSRSRPSDPTNGTTNTTATPSTRKPE